ncbi:MAG: DUF3667 domain-containing protein [Muribaculaceae bacterium]|nr:DUF3667 domain-containing protein [Muribaculaceae bacterium]
MKPKKKKKAQAKPKKKIVKKNTFYRNFRAWVLRLEHRQQNDTPPIIVRDTEQHVCHHCGTEFTGGYCPKCSMPARWKRFNWKLLFLNFMDIWGLGNRPMFRTIRDLLWRPGYMMRDYLHGHHLSYFPPFKMLAVWTVILIFMMWLFKPSDAVPGAVTENYTILDFARNEVFHGKLSATSTMLIEKMDLLFDYLDDHLLYSIIVSTIFVVIAVKWAFRKVSKYNYVETFLSQIYINCQFHILAVAGMLFTWTIPESYELLPYMEGLIWPPLVLAYDFHQLYGVTWKKAFWKTFVVFVNIVVLYFILALIAYGIFTLIEHFAN